MKLKSFKKNKKLKRTLLTLGAIALLGGGILIYRSYALYKETKSYNVLRGTIPDFSSGDIELTFTIYGKVVDQAFPSKNDGYIVNNVICENGASAEWNIDNWGLVNINSNNNKKIKCNIDFEEITLTNTSKIGDYVKMTPISTLYEIENNGTNSLTGCSSTLCYGHKTQSLNPSELNLWRIIKKNADGTIEMVSENISSNKIDFFGCVGYQKLVGALNTIAAQYENEKYTIGSRHMGYNSQTEFITDTSKFVYPAPWNSSTSNNANETYGGGDNLYNEDASLVREAISNLNANKIGSSYPEDYWLASRNYSYTTTNLYKFVGRMVSSRGSAYPSTINSENNALCAVTQSSTVLRGNTYSAYIRPIVIIKSNLQATGSGTSKDPWVLP